VKSNLKDAGEKVKDAFNRLAECERRELEIGSPRERFTPGKPIVFQRVGARPGVRPGPTTTSASIRWCPTDPSGGCRWTPPTR
jgi:hypothetical protein